MDKGTILILDFPTSVVLLVYETTVTVGKGTAIQRMDTWLRNTNIPGSIPAESAVLFSKLATTKKQG